MNTLIIWSIVCLVACILLTIYSAYQVEEHGGQSMRDSIIESWHNIIVGWTINFLANLVILPAAGFDISLATNFWIGWIYTAISLFRSFIIRRWHNRKLIRKIKNETKHTQEA